MGAHNETAWAEGALGWGPRSQQVLKLGVLLLVAVVPLVYGGSYLSDYFTAKLALLYAGIGLLLAIWLGQHAGSERIRIDRRSYDRPLVVYAAISLFSLFWAVNPLQGLETWSTQVWLLAFFLLVARFFSSSRARWGVLWTIALTSFVVSLIGLLQYDGIHLVPLAYGHWGNFGVSTLGNPNFVAHYLELSIVLIAGMVLARRRLWEKVGLGALLLFEIYYLLMTRSRGGWVAVGVGLFVLSLLYWPQSVRRTLLAGALIIVSMGAVGAVVGKGVPTESEESLFAEALEQVRAVRDRALSSFDPNHFSVLQRRLIWADTVALIADQPLLGVGTGNFEFLVPAYRTVTRHRAWAKLIANRPHMPYYAHNEYLEIWAENGVFGLAAMLWLLSALWWLAWRRLQSMTGQDARALQAGLLAALCAALTHSLFSLNLQDPTSALHFWLIAGLAVAGSHGETDSARVWVLGGFRRVFFFVAAVPAVVGVYWGLGVLVADYYYFDGQRKYYDFNQPNRASLAFAQATEWRAHDFRYHHMLGLIKMQGRHPVEATRILSRVEELHPNNAPALRLLGQGLYWSRREEEAIAILGRAIALDPLEVEPYSMLARALHDRGLRRQGEGDGDGARVSFMRAIDRWHQALAFAPENVDFLRSLGIEYFSVGSIDDAEAALARAAQLSPEDGLIQGNLGAVFLAQGRLAEAEAALVRASATDSLRAEWRSNLASVYEKQGRGEEVEQALRQAVRLDPDNLRWHLRLVELLQREGRVIEALRAAEAALQAQPQNERMAEMLRNLRRRLQKGE